MILIKMFNEVELEKNDGSICTKFVLTVTNVMSLCGHYVFPCLADIFHKKDNEPLNDR